MQVVDINSINRMSGPEFEVLVARLFEKMGFHVEMTKASHDGGIDLIAHCDVPLLQGKYIIQCKRYDGSVGEPFVRDLFGVMTAERANKGILVTNSSFTQSAAAFAAGKPLELIDGDQFLKMLARYEIVSLPQVKPSFENDQEVVRLRKLVEALPVELRWRIQLAHHVLGIVESPRGITNREDLQPYVDEAEIQLSAIYELAQPLRGKPFAFLSHSCALWLGRLQMLQSKAVDAAKWMVELKCDRYYDKAPLHPEILDDFYLANAVNVANIAAWCGKPELRQLLFTRNRSRISQLVERRKQCYAQVIGHDEHNSAKVEYILAQIRRMEHFHDNNDFLFRPSSIIRNLDSLAGDCLLLPYEEMRLQLLDICSISETIAPLHGIKLADSNVSFVDQGDEVERVIQPYMEWVQSWEVWR